MKLADVKKYLKLNDERKELQQKADAIAREQKALADGFEAYVRKNGGRKKSVELGSRKKYVLRIIEKNGRVAWKTKFVESAGKEAADKAIADAPKKESLEIVAL